MPVASNKPRSKAIQLRLSEGATGALEIEARRRSLPPAALLRSWAEDLILGHGRHLPPIDKTRQPLPDLRGYVYLVKVGGHHKVGRSANVRKRMTNLKMPFQPKLIMQWRAVNATALERDIHAEFRNNHVRGEWFSLSPSDIDRMKKFVSSSEYLDK